MQVIVDPANSIIESDETNNQLLSIVTVADVRPDLTVSNLTVPSNPLMGTSYPITANVSNTGGSSATFTVRLYDNGTSVGKQTVTLDAGTSNTLSFAWKPTIIGNHDLKVWVDPARIVVELSETNNQQNYTVNVAGMPELVISNLTVPSNPLAGTSYTVTADVTNNGGSSATFTVRLYDNGASVGKQIVTLEAGGNTTVNFNWTPNTTGSHDLNVWADPANSINEINETNNLENQTVTVMDIRQELVVTNFTIPTNPVMGTIYPVTVNVSNNGTTAATFTVRLYDNGVSVGKQIVTLEAGGNTTVNFNWKPTITGSQELMVWADPANSIVEIDETNNQLVSTVSVA